MSYVLTDNELAQVLRNRFVTEDAARAIEAAVVAKLHAQGIDTSPERNEVTAKCEHDDVELPPHWQALQFNSGWGVWEQVIPSAANEPHMVKAYTADQLRAAVLADRERRGCDAVREALEETQSLLTAMLHETRHPGEISARIVANRAALSAQEGK